MLISSAVIWVVLNVCSGVVPENPWDGARIFEDKALAQDFIRENPSPEGCITALYQGDLEAVESDNGTKSEE